MLFFIIVSVSGPHTLADKNGQAFKNAIYTLPNDTKQVALRDLTPFEWDYVYSFEAGIDTDQIKSVIGIYNLNFEIYEENKGPYLYFAKGLEKKLEKFGEKIDFYNASFEFREEIRGSHIYFVKGKEIVAKVFGETSNLKFDFSFGISTSGYLRLKNSDNPVFNMRIENGTKWFSIAEE